MAQGSKKAYTGKQKRTAAKIAQSEKTSGKSSETAERIAWATVNKHDHGGKKSGSGRKKKATGKKTTGKKTAAKNKKATTQKSAPKKKTSRKSAKT